MKKVIGLASRKRTGSKEKTQVILNLLLEHPITRVGEWIKIAYLPKSSFYEWKYKVESFTGKDDSIKNEIKDIVAKSKNRYGYRRVTQALRNKGMVVNHKKSLRIMKELSLLCTKFSKRTRKYSSYKGRVGKIANNILNREFFADKPNKIWLTDITEFRLKGNEDRIKNRLNGLSPIQYRLQSA